MTDHDFSRALILSSRLYPLLDNKYLNPLVTYIIAKLTARRVARLVNRLQELSARMPG